MFVATDVVINMVDVAQLAEHLVVAQGVVGSSPIIRPTRMKQPVSSSYGFFLFKRPV